MRSSGGGNRDLTMLTVPLTIFILFVVLSGGGLDSVLRALERMLWVRSNGWADSSPEVSCGRVLIRTRRRAQSAVPDFWSTQDFGFLEVIL